MSPTKNLNFFKYFLNTSSFFISCCFSSSLLKIIIFLKYFFFNKYFIKALPKEPVPPVIKIVPFIYIDLYCSFFEQNNALNKLVKKINLKQIFKVNI